MLIKKRISKISILIFVLSLIIIGCTPAQRPIDERDRVDINQDRINGAVINDRDNQNENLFDTNNLGYENIPNNLNLDYSLEQHIQNIDGIGEAVIITDGNTAYVGLEAEEGNNQNDLRKMQTEVAARIRARVSQIERIYVTSDIARVEEIKKLRNSLNTGVQKRDTINKLKKIFS